MKLLLDDRKLIKAIATEIEYGVWGNVGDAHSWKIADREYLIGNASWEVEEDDVPLYVTVDNYYYIDGEFNPFEEYVPDVQKQINELTEVINEYEIELFEQTFQMSSMMLAIEDLGGIVEI